MFKFYIQNIIRIFSILVLFKKTIVVHSCGNFGFTANGKFNYYAVKKIFPDRKIIFISEGKTSYGFRVKSIKGFIFLHFSKFYITDGAIPYSVNLKYKTVLSTWHGIPIKNIGLDAKSEKISKFTKEKLRKQWSKFEVFSSGAYCQEVLIKSMLAKEENFHKALTPLMAETIKAVSPKNKNKKIKRILYLPTYRDWPTTRDWDLLRNELFIEFILNKNINVYYKYHPLDEQAHVANFPKNLINLNNQDYLEALKETDLLITDYSSVVFDAILCDIKYCFYVPDYNDFIKKRGLNAVHLYRGELKLSSINMEEISEYLGKTLQSESLYSKQKEIFYHNSFDYTSEELIKKILS